MLSPSAVEKRIGGSVSSHCQEGCCLRSAWRLTSEADCWVRFVLACISHKGPLMKTIPLLHLDLSSAARGTSPAWLPSLAISYFGRGMQCNAVQSESHAWGGQSRVYGNAAKEHFEITGDMLLARGAKAIRRR